MPSWRQRLGKREKLRIGLKDYEEWGFPGGTVVKNLPASAGNTGAIPGPRRSHMLRSN